MKKTNLLVSAALAGLALASMAGAKDIPKAEKQAGECHGINGCKGQGECGGKDHACGGKNGCKGHGWKKMTKAECKKAKGKFKALSMGM